MDEPGSEVLLGAVTVKLEVDEVGIELWALLTRWGNLAANLSPMKATVGLSLASSFLSLLVACELVIGL